MQDGDTLLAAVVLLIFGTWCLLRGLARVIKAEQRTYIVAPAEQPPDYVVWARCDTGREGISSWRPVYAGDDLHRIWALARADYPLDKFDLLPLPKEHTPEGQLP